MGLVIRCRVQIGAHFRPHGSFLVRESANADKFILVVNYSGKPQSFPIEITLDQKYKLGMKKFDDLMELIFYLSEHSLRMKDGKALKLGSPAPGGQMLVIPGKVGRWLHPSPPHHHRGFLRPPVSGSVSDLAQLQFTSL